MKNIFKFLILSIIFVFIGCTTEPKDPITTANGFSSLINDVSITPTPILTVGNGSTTYGEYSWGLSDNGATSIAKYSLVIFDHDNDPNLLNPVEYDGVGTIISATSRTSKLTNKELNDLMNKLPTFKCSEMNIDIRIKSAVGANPAIAFVQYSNAITRKVTGYNTKSNVISFVKNGENLTKGYTLLTSNFTSLTDYECYAFLTLGNYKFYKPDICGNFTTPTVIGKGTTAGTLETTGQGLDINIPTTGYYFIRANLTANTYSILPYNTIGINGRGSRAGSGNSNVVPMLDPENDNIWTLDVLLVRGLPIKFPVVQRDVAVPLVEPVAPNALQNPAYVLSTSISGRPVELGASSTMGLLNSVTAGAITEILLPGDFNANQKDKYRVTVDVRNPRKYTYSLVKI